MTITEDFEFRLGQLIAVCIPSLDEWHTLCDWMETLSCSELITGEASDIYLKGEANG